MVHTLFLLLLLRCLSCGRISTRCRTPCCWCGCCATAGADVQEQFLDIFALECFGEEGAPDGLDVFDFRGCDEGLELVGL